MKFNTVAKFSETENGKKLVSMMEDYTKNYMSDNNIAKMSYDTKYTLDEKGVKINELFKSELARRSKYSVEDFDTVEDYANFSVVAEMAAQMHKVLIDASLPILLNQSGLALFAEFHYGGYGDVFKFEVEDNSIYEVSRMGRRQKHGKTQQKKKNDKVIATDLYGLTTIATLPQVLLGEDMIAKDAVKASLSIERKIYNLVIAKVKATTDAISDSNLIAGSYTEATALAKFRNASAKNGAPIVIVGDAVALKSLLPAESRTRILLQDEFNTMGYMTEWNGYKVVAFDVVDDGANGVLGLETNKIYGIPVNGGKLIHVAIGATIANTDDAFENNNLAILSTYRKELGVDLATNKKVAKITL